MLGTLECEGGHRMSGGDYQLFMIEVNMARSGLILNGFYMIKYPGCDPTNY